MRNEELIDPFFQDTPWELIHDDDGILVGEVYVLDLHMLPAKFMKGEGRRNDSVHRVRGAGSSGKAKSVYTGRIR
ncbi:hypothetical protein GCM10008013_12290 [Paenibacillus segetis]|uniref:Uncharacterized protein n=1 Tax=Paenibacillus segetis TaxID=1325360 RepID=A0ABQ1YAI6_9BACL|nr:hypothetical protein GCM10008013_12290 [Paenibacillus segetis]